MNIEQLSKSQIVLLTLLVSFVTSIATGIVTVSLMEQAPPVVSQTVNRIIERTVETVVPASQSAATVVTREQTVVIKEAELISQAVAKVSSSIVRLHAGESKDAAVVGLGIVLGADGSIVADIESVGDATSVSISLPDGTRTEAPVTKRDKVSGFVFLQASSTVATWKPAVFAGAKAILGQSVVSLYGKSLMRVEDGIVTGFVPVGEDDTVLVVDTSVSSDSIAQGSPLVNTDGEVIGVSTMVSRTSSSKGFIASSALIEKPQEKPAEKKAE